MNIKLDEIKKVYNNREVLNVDTLEFQRGKIYAVLGPNGSGKSTMARIIAGIEKPDSGQVYYDEEKTFKKDRLAYLPQKSYMFDLTVLKNIVLGMPKGNSIREKAGEALKLVGLEDFSDARARSLSGGEMQRVAVARTLVCAKQVFILDEPATSIDISSIKLVENYIKKAGNDNSTVIFTTHSPSQAIRVADEAVFLFNGRVIEKGIPGDIIMNPKEYETKEFMQNWRA